MHPCCRLLPRGFTARQLVHILLYMCQRVFVYTAIPSRMTCLGKLAQERKFRMQSITQSLCLARPVSRDFAPQLPVLLLV